MQPLTARLQPPFDELKPFSFCCSCRWRNFATQLLHASNGSVGFLWAAKLSQRTHKDKCRFLPRDEAALSVRVLLFQD